MRFIDITGVKFGRLVVLRKDPETITSKVIRWVCLCECGKSHNTTAGNLKKGHVQSCGCYKIDKAKTNTLKHGHTAGGHTRFSGAYKSWAKMRERVISETCVNYDDYGGRGITIAPEWDSFEQFYKDMGPRPQGFSIERVDNQGMYEKGNCIWADRFIQANNKRNNVKIEWMGVSKAIGVWARDTGIPRDVLYKRIFTHKWEIERAMTQSVRMQANR